MAETFLRKQGVLARTGLSKSDLYAKAAKGDFPRPIKIGSSSFWICSEVDNWINEHVRRSRGISRETAQTAQIA